MPAHLRAACTTRYTSVTEVVIKPNPKGSSLPQVQKDGEADKVCGAALTCLPAGIRIVSSQPAQHSVLYSTRARAACRC